MKPAIFLALILLLVCVIIDVANGSTQCTNGQTCFVNEDTLRFFVLGDFGGLPMWPYASWAQNKVAKTMANVGDSKRTHFQLELGDNMYFNGVDDVNDHRFQKSFEEVYQGDSMNKPWYVIAGNHDHFGNVSAQVLYSQISNRWVFPSLYYSVNYQFAQQTTVDFLMLDTIVLCGNTRDISNADFLEVFLADSHKPMVPKDPVAAEQQWAWIEQQLQQSKADYLFVSGHFPMYSISEHGPTECLLNRLKPLLHKYRVNAYLSGHDHSLQHISYSEDGTFVDYIVSGAASRTDRSTKNEDKIPNGSLRYSYPSSGWNPFAQLGFTTGAFIYVELSSVVGRFDFYNGDGERKYSFETLPRSKLSSDFQ